jgi:hypothetical protein
MKVASQVCGTLNNWKDRDQYWTSEIQISLNDISRDIELNDFKKEITILIARYNYSAYMDKIGAELSMFPSLSKTFYHLTHEYAELILQK